MSTNYENYKKRMEGVRRFLGVLYKFRALIISAVVLIIAATVSLMATNGIVYGEVAPPPEITYGELLTYRASAFMSDVYYEYCEAGHEKEPNAWTKEIPRLAGKYSVRAVSYRTFGSLSYGTTYTFTIKPLEVELSVADEVVYGERPLVTGGLINGDIITDFNYDFDEIDSAQTTVYIDSIKAENTDGVDVSGCYVFKSEPESILFVRREITVEVTDKTKVYDGTPLTSDEHEITVGTLADGDALTVECDGQITDAGEVTNAPSFTVMHGEVNVSIQYKITPLPGKLTVEPRPITVKSATRDWDYDGETHFDAGFEVVSEYDIVEGETASVVTHTEIVNAGGKSNALSVAIEKADGTDSTDNYDITYDFGELTVNKLTIGISTEGYSWEYDGDTHKLPEYSIISTVRLVDGETASVQSSTGITNVGTAKNEVKLKVVKADGTNSTDNYKFVLKDDDAGLLEITPRPIEIKTLNGIREYDGTEFKYERYEITSEKKLVPAEEIVIDYSYGISEVQRGDDNEVLSVENTITVKIKKTATGADSTGNYKIDYDYGTLTLTPRTITVKTATNRRVYDGTEFKDETLEKIGRAHV